MYTQIRTLVSWQDALDAVAEIASHANDNPGASDSFALNDAIRLEGIARDIRFALNNDAEWRALSAQIRTEINHMKG